MKKILYTLFFLIQINQFFAKTLIITHCYNRPDFIRLQHKTFKKLIQDDYEYVVFNDAPDLQTSNNIMMACSDLNIRCFRIPQDIHTRPYLPRLTGDPLHRPNIRHANCVQYSLDILGFDHDGIVAIIDSDMFLTRTFNFSEYMKDKHIAAFTKGADNGVWYLCPALCFLNMSKLPDKRSLNFNCGIANGASVDSGGWTYFYLRQYPELSIARANVIWSYQLYLGNYDIQRPVDHSISDAVKIATYLRFGFNEKEIKFLLKKPDTFEFFLDNHFLHYHAGSKHDKLSENYYANKNNIFTEFINDVVKD